MSNYCLKWQGKLWAQKELVVSGAKKGRQNFNNHVDPKDLRQTGKPTLCIPARNRKTNSGQVKLERREWRKLSPAKGAFGTTPQDSLFTSLQSQLQAGIRPQYVTSQYGWTFRHTRWKGTCWAEKLIHSDRWVPHCKWNLHLALQ